MAQALIKEHSRRAVQQFSDCLNELGQPAAARWLPPLPPGRPVDEHLNEWFDKAREFLLEVPTEVQLLLRRDVDDGADVNVLLSNAALFAQLRDVLGDAVITDVMKHLAERSGDEVAA